GHGLAEHGAPSSVQLGDLAEHVDRGTAGESGVLKLGLRRAPEREDLVADVVDEYTVMGEDTVGERPHNIDDPLACLRRADPLADPAESTDVGEEQADLAVLPPEHVRACGQLAGQLRGEELLEPDPRG